MKNLFVWAILIGVAAPGSAHSQQAYNFNDSPDNFQNSLSNFNNSPDNFQNSTNNFNNSPNNFNATNGVYDNRGNRIGYEVQAPSGVINIYSNDGQRMGYVPSPRQYPH